MLGTIGFKGYRIKCIIGTEPYERTSIQDLFLDLKVEIDFSIVGTSGRLEDTVNYITLSKICNDMAIEGKYHVLEKYASDVLEELFNRFSLKSAWIKIKKPLAISDAECAFVELKREYSI